MKTDLKSFVLLVSLQLYFTDSRDTWEGIKRENSDIIARRTQGFILVGHKSNLERIKALVQLEMGCFISNLGSAYRLLFLPGRSSSSSLAPSC